MPTGLQGNVTVVRGGESFKGSFRVVRDKLRVGCEFGSKATEINKLRTTAQCKRLLNELVADHFK